MGKGSQNPDKNHYNWVKKRFDPVQQKKGGGIRFIQYSDKDPLTIEDVRRKASGMFFQAERVTLQETFWT